VVCEWLRVEPTRPFEVWHVPSLKAARTLVDVDGAGEMHWRRIEIGDFMARRQARFAVGHELVHWYARGVWERLPHAVEEGLADEIGLRFNEDMRTVREGEASLARSSMTAERVEKALAVTKRSWQKAPTELRLDAYAVGIEIVQRIGVDGLHAMCERAAQEGLERVPIAWLDVLPPDPNGWKVRFKLAPSASTEQEP
jgi:hypothetical protein